MQYSDKYINQLKRRISELNPHLILLFGSHASGTPGEDSDIDLIVVTKDEFILNSTSSQCPSLVLGS